MCEGFNLLIEDLRSLSVTGVVLVEGFRLLPDFVRPHLFDPNDAVWLIPTPEFRRAAFAARDRSEAFWMRTTDPGRAMANLLARDQIFTNELAADAASGGMRTLAVDGSRSLEVTVATIARQSVSRLRTRETRAETAGRSAPLPARRPRPVVLPQCRPSSTGSKLLVPGPAHPKR